MKTQKVITATPLTPASEWMQYFDGNELLLIHPRNECPRAILAEQLRVDKDSFVINYKSHPHEIDGGTLF